VQTIIASIAVTLLLSLYQFGVRNFQATANSSNDALGISSALDQDGTGRGVELKTATGQDGPEKAIEQVYMESEASEKRTSNGEAGEESETKQPVKSRFSWE